MCGKACTAQWGKMDIRCAFGTGLAKILGCSLSKASEVKRSGLLDDAIVQNGKIIVIDKDKALQLFAKND